MRPVAAREHRRDADVLDHRIRFQLVEAVRAETGQARRGERHADLLGIHLLPVDHAQQEAPRGKHRLADADRGHLAGVELVIHGNGFAACIGNGKDALPVYLKVRERSSLIGLAKRRVRHGEAHRTPIQQRRRLQRKGELEGNGLSGVRPGDGHGAGALAAFADRERQARETAANALAEIRGGIRGRRHLLAGIQHAPVPVARNRSGRVTDPGGVGGVHVGVDQLNKLVAGHAGGVLVQVVVPILGKRRLHAEKPEARRQGEILTPAFVHHRLVAGIAIVLQQVIRREQALFRVQQIRGIRYGDKSAAFLQVRPREGRKHLVKRVPIIVSQRTVAQHVDAAGVRDHAHDLALVDPTEHPFEEGVGVAGVVVHQVERQAPGTLDRIG